MPRPLVAQTANRVPATPVQHPKKHPTPRPHRQKKRTDDDLRTTNSTTDRTHPPKDPQIATVSPQIVLLNASEQVYTTAAEPHFALPRQENALQPTAKRATRTNRRLDLPRWPFS